MPLDPRIPLQFRGPQIDNPMDVQAKAMNMSQLARQGQIQEQQLKKGAMEMDLEKERQLASKKRELAWSIQPGGANWSQVRQKAIELGFPDADKAPEQYPGDEFVKSMKMATLSAQEQLENMWKEREHSTREREANARISESKRRGAAAPKGFRYQLNQQTGEQELVPEVSVTESKQLGLYEMGQEAEQQYQTAVANKDEYDPTSVGQVIDNDETGLVPNWMKNKNAQAARSAMSSWVEAYLRDASGAAIPPSERLAYAKDYFPMPGDDAQVVANKAALRRQKMQNALTASGPASMLASKPSPRAPNQGGSGGFSLGIDKANASGPKVLKTNEIDWAD